MAKSPIKSVRQMNRGPAKHPASSPPTPAPSPPTPAPSADKRRDGLRLYAASDKGREAHRRYEASDKGRERHHRYVARRAALASMVTPSSITKKE